MSSNNNYYFYLITGMHDTFLTAKDISLAHFQYNRTETSRSSATWYFGGVNYLINCEFKKVLNRLEIQAVLLKDKIHFFQTGVITIKSSTVNWGS